MKLIYAQGFSKNEKLEWKPVIFGNIVQSFRLIFDAMNEMDIKFQNEENEASPLHPQPRARGFRQRQRQRSSPRPACGSSR